MVDLVDRLNVLLKQDKNCYSAKDYLSPVLNGELQQCEIKVKDPEKSPCSSSDTLSACSTNNNNNINEAWREKICEWSYQVADHFDFQREVVSISISFLDRYLSRRTVDKKQFQLVAMTALYLAVKIYEPTSLSITSMIELSRGFFSADQMEAMEKNLLESLSWHVHPPTAFCLARHFLQVLPSKMSLSMKHDIMELARFLTELAVIDYFFVPRNTSSLSLGAILNAMETLRLDEYIPNFLQQLSLLDDFNPNSTEVKECRLRLKQLYIQGGYGSNQIPFEPEDIRDTTDSPICVSAFKTTARISRCTSYDRDLKNCDRMQQHHRTTRR